MANEGSFTYSMSLRKQSGALIILGASYQKSFTFDVDGSVGPTPGGMVVPVGGKIIRFGELITPGIIVIKNYDATNYITYGLYDPDSKKFYPMGEVFAGEEWPWRLSRDFLERFEGTGTGTTGRSMYLMLKASEAPVNASVEAYER